MIGKTHTRRKTAATPVPIQADTRIAGQEQGSSWLTAIV